MSTETAVEKRWVLEVEVAGEPARSHNFPEARLTEDYLIELAEGDGATLTKAQAKGILDTKGGGQVPGIRLYPAE